MLSCITKFKAFSFAVALFGFLLVGCGGSDSSDLSISATYSSFPSFDESDLTIVSKEAAKGYDSLSSEALSSFFDSLVSKDFIDDNSLFCKTNAKDSMKACAFSFINFLTIKLNSDDNSRMPNDADFSDIFGSVPGNIAGVYRGITVVNNQIAQDKINSYSTAVQTSGFAINISDYRHTLYVKADEYLAYYIDIIIDGENIALAWVIERNNHGGEVVSW